ncbi:MAG: hypothetical protein ACYDCK_15515 [Thermoplasmatota archaeon]
MSARGGFTLIRDATYFKAALFVLALVAGAGLGASSPQVGDPLHLPATHADDSKAKMPPPVMPARMPTPAPSSAPAKPSDADGDGALHAPRVIMIPGESTATSVGTPCSSGLQSSCPVGIHREAVFTLEQASPARATLVATWKASTPLATVLSISFSSGASIEGPSPQVLEIPVATLASAGSYFASATPTSPGAMLADNVHYVLTLEYE